MKLSQKYLEALNFALVKHDSQTRKGTGIPYFAHVSAVSSLAMEYGADEDQAIAALLHDTMEDCDVTKAELEETFGPRVAGIVADCTDSEQVPKPPWHDRKRKYLEHLDGVHSDTFLVSACDKLHNARAIVRDVRYEGAAVWTRFSAKPEDILWYYESLLAVFERRLKCPSLLGDFRAEVKAMRELVKEQAG